MTFETALTWSWLGCLTTKRAEALTRTYGDLDAALGELSAAMLQALGMQEDNVQRTLGRLKRFDAHTYASELTAQGVTFLTADDPRYPTPLRAVPDYPPFLYLRGDLAILARPLIAVVGTRRMTAYGQAVTGRIVRSLLGVGVVTVSGLALGVDAEVARSTLADGGFTIAVLAHGMGEIFPPTNAALTKEIFNKGGLLLTEYPLDQHPTAFTFPERNRIIAGLARATLVIEAGAKSGALITARLALEYGRDALAIPGSVLSSASAGCHALIAASGARLVTCGDDVLEELGIARDSKERSDVCATEIPEETAIIVALRSASHSVSALVEITHLSASVVSTALTALELRGSVKNAGDGTWFLSC